MREWVVGFLHDGIRVVLIRKTKPAWMAGMLNGVGGKLEEGETPLQAMTREFYEETGLWYGRWHEFVRLTAVTTEDRSGEVTPEAGVVHFFESMCDPEKVDEARTMEGEEIEVHYLSSLLEPHPNIVPNLRWLLPLAAHRADHYETFEVVETWTKLRAPA